MKIAAQYLRMSTDVKRYSLANQRTVIAAYARQEGFEVVRTYIDAGRSGLTTARRDGLKALLGDVLAGAPFGTILVVDVSRWGRYQDPDEAAHYEYLCREAGVRVRYCAEPFTDDDSPTSALMKNLKRVMAAEYSRQLSDRCRAGLRRAIMAGARAGGPAPFGFARQVFDSAGVPGAILLRGERRPRADQQVRIVPGPAEHVATLRRIFAMFVADLLGMSDIARILNDEGVSHSRAGPWNAERVRCVLTNELAIGVFAFNRSVWRLGKLDSRTARADWQRLKVGEPLVPIRTFVAARGKLDALNGAKFPDDEMIEKLRRLLKAEGRLSRRLIDITPGIPCVPTYIRRFGSMAAVYERVGYTRTRRQREHTEPAGLEPAQIAAGLRNLLRSHGYLSAKLINASPEVPYADTIRRRLGSLEAAYAMVGYTPTRQEMLVAAWRRRRQRAGG